MTFGTRIGERSTRVAADAVGEVARDARSVGTAVVDHLPRVVTGVIAATIGLVLALLLAKAVERALGRTRADHLAVVMLSRIVRLVGVISALLVGLAIAGVAVGSVLAGLAVIGGLVNLTRRGKRRTVVMVGVDYRDDHDEARAVILDAVRAVEGVLDHPEPEVLLTELGESSVNFEVRYWTRPDIRTVQRTQDRVLAAVKRGIQDAGLTIPWPIRTLVPDGTFRLSREGLHHG